MSSSLRGVIDILENLEASNARLLSVLNWRMCHTATHSLAAFITLTPDAIRPTMSTIDRSGQSHCRLWIMSDLSVNSEPAPVILVENIDRPCNYIACF